MNPGEGLAGCASLSSFFCFLTLTFPHDKVYVHNSEHLLSTRAPCKARSSGLPSPSQPRFLKRKMEEAGSVYTWPHQEASPVLP